MEITTVKGADNAPIEKKVISGISIDIASGLVNFNHQNAVKRFDGEWVESPNYGQALSLISSDFEGADLTAFNNALNNFKTAISVLAAKKLGV
jgi:hypothetical protein